MPYIKEARRELLRKSLRELLVQLNCMEPTEGDINYVITTIITDWVLLKRVSYSTLNSAIGILESAKQEFYRRRVAPYEDKKLAENGDV